ncbi:hypothetical protein HYG93_05900 [Acinetobacter sp. SwsAc6]|uniref:hypothetical protein n=1 Tax=Acinetobacter sp. SwsAc6 TaxID=2749439 RepID=UPI0015BBA965|nr:hypothetical protein [Acinetobacter sp. SwsAc6]NWK73831.1 hypothetical protein [Acinetobacter sp. SwsAc6]
MLKLDKKKSSQILSDCLFIYLLILATGIGLFIIVIECFGGATTDIPSVLANVFVWSATLMAPFVVLLLANAWKIEYQKNLIKDISIDLIKNLIRCKHTVLEMQNFNDLAKNNHIDHEFNESLTLEFEKNQTEYNELWRNINKDSEIFATIINLENQRLFSTEDKQIINSYFQDVSNHYHGINQAINQRNFKDFIQSDEFTNQTQTLITKRKLFLETMDNKIAIVNSHINLDMD